MEPECWARGCDQGVPGQGKGDALVYTSPSAHVLQLPAVATGLLSVKVSGCKQMLAIPAL